jgi:hypothetical protein
MHTTSARSNHRIFRFALVFLCMALVFVEPEIGEAQSGAVRTQSATPRPPTQSSTGQAVTGKSTVRGRVVYKDNAQPLKGVRVRLFTSRDDDALGRNPIAHTNDRGEFQLQNLAAGKYYVTVEGPGIAMQSGFGLKIPLPVSAIPRREDFEEIVPKHDATFTVDGTNAVEVEVRIPRGGKISGKVMKADGAPAKGISVSFISRENGSGPYNARFSAQTDQEGVYQIENIPPGDYVVAASIPDRAASASLDISARMRGEGQVVTYHPAASSVRDAITVRVDAGREVGGVNITLVGRNAFGVSGTIVHQRDGTPIGGARILLRNKESELEGSLRPGMGQRTTIADEDGRWSFSNVMEGSYSITGLAPVSRPARSPDDGPPDQEQAFRESRQRFLITQQEVVIAGADFSGLQLAISGPGSIVGRVESEKGEALPADLVIFLELVGKDIRPGPPLPVRIRPDGSFTYSGIQGGDVYVAAALPRNSKYFIKSMSANGEDPRRTPLKIIEGGEAGPLQIVLSSGVVTVNGRVLSEKGAEGLGNLVVLLAPVEPGKQRFRTAYFSTRTSPEGAYSVTAAPGEYFVFARRRDELPALVTEDFVKKQAGTATRAVLAPGEQKHLDLRVP